MLLVISPFPIQVRNLFAEIDERWFVWMRNGFATNWIVFATSCNHPSNKYDIPETKRKNYIIWLCVLNMSPRRFSMNLHSIVAWMSRNSLLRTVWLNGWVSVYELSGCGFESRCSTSFIEPSWLNFILHIAY